VHLVEGDLAQQQGLARLVREADVVLHLAGLVKARSEAEFLHVNRDGTAGLARAARAAATSRLVMVSSLAATGPSSASHPSDELTPPRPVTPYGRSKLAGEQALRASGQPFVIVRPPAVYGPGDRAFLPLFRAARLGVVPVFGDGQQVLSLIHVDDLAEALAAIVAAPAEVDGRVFHAAHPQAVTQRALVAAIARAVGRDHVRVLPLPRFIVRGLLAVSAAVARVRGQVTQLAPNKAPELLAPAWTCSSTEIERCVGWRARIALADGLAETADWYRRQGWSK
jgi:nucleoside-diphosphate-sugar epimerase